MTTLQLPGQVQLVSPPDQGLLSSDTVFFRWHPSSPGVIAYWIEEGKDSTFANSLVDSSLTDTSTTITGLADGIQYFWRVRAKNTSGWGIFSERRSFSILTTIVDETSSLPSVVSLSQNYPNPFNPQTVIVFEIPVSGSVVLEVFDNSGRRIRTLVKGIHPAGRYSVQWDGKDESGRIVGSGIYFYQLHAGDVRITKKMLLIK